MKQFKLNTNLWETSLGTPTYFQKDGGLVALALCVDIDQRLPQEGFSVHSGLEVFVVLSGEVSVGTESGIHIVEEGTLAVIDAHEKHYTQNRSGEPARLIAFALSGS